MCLSCGLLYAYGRFKKYDYERCQCVTCTVPSKDSSDDLDRDGRRSAMYGRSLL